MENKCFSFLYRILDEAGSIVGMFVYLNNPQIDPELIYQELLRIWFENIKNKRCPVPTHLLFGIREHQSSQELIEVLMSLENHRGWDGEQVLKVKIQELEDDVSLRDWQRAIYEQFQVEETKGYSLDVGSADVYYI